MSQTDSDWSRSPILIGGHQRSGTNLILSLLDSHPNLVVFGPGHLHLFGENLELASSLQGKDRIEFVLDQEILKTVERGQKNNVRNIDEYFEFGKFRQHLREGVGQDYSWGNIVRNIFIAYEKALDKKKDDIVGFVENTPGTEHDFPISAAFFPDSKMIYMVRDPRDVWTSYKKAKGGSTDRSVWRFIHRWIDSAVTAGHNCNKYGDKYYILEYNELVRNPEKVMSDIANFLGIPFQDVLLEPTKAGAPFTGNSQHEKDFSGISTDSVSKYKHELSRPEIKALNGVCMPLYRELTGVEQPDVQGQMKTLRNYFRIAHPGLYYHQNPNVSVTKYIQDYAKFLYKSETLDLDVSL